MTQSTRARLFFCMSAIIASFTATADSEGLSMGLSGSLVAGGTTVEKNTVSQMQGGGHDPKINGFNITNVEMSLQSAVDPYFDARANIVYLIDEDGGSLVELEEAFFITRALPWRLQAKGGHYLTEFGRVNNSHPHTWWFVDQPVIHSRVLGGDGTRAPGMRMSWLAPASWYSEVMMGAQNPAGETQVSFMANGDGVGGYTPISREVKSPHDFLHSMRWLNGFDIGNTLSANIGVSMMGGANDLGENARTRIWGADTYFKWQPESSAKGFPFFAWHTEWIMRKLDADATDTLPTETMQDSGYVTQIAWGYKPRYVLGARYEQAFAANGDTSDWTRAKRTRTSVNWTWYPTEFSKIRLQYNFDQSELLPENSHGLWLQVEYNIGSHMAHVF